MQKLIIALCIFALASATTQPSAPVWPDQWQAKFHEEMNDGIFGKGTTTGTFYYDWANNLFRIDRASGKKDRYCGTVKLKDTPCTQYVVDDVRYLHYPELNHCCACCSSKDGCGLTLPTWMKDATYVGQTTLNETVVDEWTIKGLQTNYYYETPDSRIPVELYMAPNSKMDWDINTYSTSIDPNIFKLPSICKATQLCPKLSVCGAVRMQSQMNKIIKSLVDKLYNH